MPMEDEKSYMVRVAIELEDYGTSDNTVYISVNLSLANDSSDFVEEIKEKAITKAKNIPKTVLLEDSQQELF